MDGAVSDLAFQDVGETTLRFQDWNRRIVTIGKGAPGHVRFTGNDGTFYDMPKAMMPDVIAALVRFALECE